MGRQQQGGRRVDIVGGRGHFDFSGPIRLFIHTKEGVMAASPNDWIIQGLKGEFYPCKPDVFEASYELVEESTTGRKQ